MKIIEIEQVDASGEYGQAVGSPRSRIDELSSIYNSMDKLQGAT